MSFSNPKHTAITNDIFPLENVVLIGLGIAGLLTAIYLLMREFNGTLHIVDKHLNEFNRDHTLIEHVFPAISKSIAPLKPILYEKSSFDELHKSLYERFQNLVAEMKNPEKVKFYKKKFIGLDNHNHVQLQELDGSPAKDVILPDLLLEGSSSQRAVINACNKLSPIFTINPIGNPDIHFALLRIYFPVNWITPFNNELAEYHSYGNELHLVRTILDLQKMGWPHYFLPNFTCAPDSNSESKDMDSFIKSMFVVQIPGNLNNEQDIIKYARSILRLCAKTESLPELKLQEFAGSRKAISDFWMRPRRVTPHFIPGIPLIITLGDSTIDPPFELGRGIIHLVNRANVLKEALQIEDGKIIGLNTSILNKGYDEDINKLLKVIEESNAQVEMQRAVHVKRIPSLFRRAYQNTNANADEKKHFASHIHKFEERDKALRQFNFSEKFYQYVEKDAVGKFNLTTICQATLGYFDGCVSDLEKALKGFDYLTPDERKNQEPFINDVAKNAKLIADHYSTMGNSSLADKYHCKSQQLFAFTDKNSSTAVLLLILSNRNTLPNSSNRATLTREYVWDLNPAVRWGLGYFPSHCHKNSMKTSNEQVWDLHHEVRCGR